MVKRYDPEGKLPYADLVLGSDYDALAAELATLQDVSAAQAAVGTRALDRIHALEQDNADVAKINVDLMQRNRDLEAALRTEITAMQEVDRGSTHWKGCEMSHPRCAAVARMNAALSSGMETGTAK